MVDELEVRIRSAEDLQDVRLLKVGKVLHSYALAWVSTSPKEALHKLTRRPPPGHQQRLPRVDAQDEDDEEGTLYPAWPRHQASLKLAVPATSSSQAFVVIRLYGQRSRSPLRGSKSSRVVGTVTIPLTDIATAAQGHSWQLLSYHVKRPSGRLQGVLNVLARFTSPHAISFSPPRPSAPPLPAAFPAHHLHFSMSAPKDKHCHAL